MVAKAEVVCQQSVPSLDVQCISSSQTVRLSDQLDCSDFCFFGVIFGNWLMGLCYFWI